MGDFSGCSRHRLLHVVMFAVFVGEGLAPSVFLKADSFTGWEPPTVFMEASVTFRRR